MSYSSSYTTEYVLQTYTKGPNSGIFTDGACLGNPGPGGWGFVYVENDDIIDQKYGSSPNTTNNKMELTALIEAYKTIDPNKQITIYSDSNLCVQTVNQWAKNWKTRGWKRKTGPIANLELVKELYELSLIKKATLKWIKAHIGYKWNEYADSIANAWNREIL